MFNVNPTLGILDEVCDFGWLLRSVRVGRDGIRRPT